MCELAPTQESETRVTKRISLSTLPWIVWTLTLIALPCWMANDGPLAWDLNVILDAMHSVHAGADPYAVGIARQDAFLQSAASHAGAARPFVYVYSPITLPLLRAMGMLPESVTRGVYWMLYLLAIVFQLWTASCLPCADEKVFIGIVTPITLFFPGLLLFDTVFSGNIAFLLYGLMLAGLLMGWKRGHWRWFYAAVLIASCFKAPYLIYLVLPLCCARRRWFQVALVGGLGVALFAIQAVLWPELFRSYTHALDRIFSYNNDFGSGPVGRIGALLAVLTGRYAMWTTLAYALLAALLFGVLLYFAYYYKRGYLAAEQWIPLALLGVLLLNPRLIEYDIFPFTVPMLLILYRLIRPMRHAVVVTAGLAVIWVAANVYANRSHEDWKCIECAVLVGVFMLGCWQMSRKIMSSSVPVQEIAEAAD